MHGPNPTRTRSILAASLLALLALAPAAGCVPASRHREVLAELERIRRENLELQRDLAEQRVRLRELAEAGAPAVPPGPARAAPAAPEPEAAGGAEGLRTPASVAPMAGAPSAGIEEETIRDPEPAMAAAGEDGGRILALARKYASQGGISQAISIYSRFIQDYPFSPLLPEAFMERGRARLKTGDQQGALEDFRTVVEAFPESPLVGAARQEAARLGGA